MANPRLELARVMVDALVHDQLVELARESKPRLTSNRRSARLDELGLLRELLQDVPPPPGATFSTISKATYEASRTAGARAADTLARRYGSWRAACRAAANLSQDGGRDGSANPWPRRAPTTQPYTQEEVLKALILVKQRTGRTPTTLTYQRWVTAMYKRGGNRALRIPGARTVYRFFPAASGGWRAANAAAEAFDEASRAARRAAE